MRPSVSVVLPTFNRLAALKGAISVLLAMADVCELIVIDDGSSDGTAEYLVQTDPRLVVMRLEDNVGSTAARNLGLDNVRGDYALMADDDILLPGDYISTLLAEMSRLQADIVSAPWIYTWDSSLEKALSDARRKARTTFTFDTHPSIFPTRAIQTPFLPPMALVSKRVLDAGIRYDNRYTYNGWREETSFFVTAAERGFNCWLTPNTFSYQTTRHDGGQPRQPFRYEYYAARNNWIFLTKHQQYLRSEGQVSSRIGAQGKFLVRRGARLCRVAVSHMKSRGN